MSVIDREAWAGNWLVVGTRDGGDRLVLDQAVSKGAAERKAELFREQLEGYRSIEVEHVGEHAGDPAKKPGARYGVHRGDDDLGDSVATDPIPPPSRKENEVGINRLKEAHQTLHERAGRNGSAAAAADKPADRPAEAPAPGRVDRGRKVREVLQELGPDATRVEVATRCGFEPSTTTYYKARQDLGYPPSGAGGASPAPKAGKRPPRPAMPVVEPRPKPKPVAAPQRPAARDTDQVLEGIALLAQAADKLGGIDQCRRAIETLELLRS